LQSYTALGIFALSVLKLRKSDSGSPIGSFFTSHS